MEQLVSLCKRRGFIYPGSEIYGGLSGTWDYGPLGIELKRNIEALWWNMFVIRRDDMYGVDAAILMNQAVWKASGHVDGFADPLVECTKCKRRFREDHLEDKQACPECDGALGDVRQFNMMFKTSAGALEGEESTVYLRPETAQGMFVNFKNVIDSFHPKLPFGLAQIGKAFRNEIAPRDFIFRSREFSQMEIEYFVEEADWMTRFEDWRQMIHVWMRAIGIAPEMVHELEVAPHDLAHYSKRTIDFEFDFPFGRKELYGLAYRTDFDLKNHAHASSQTLVIEDDTGAKVVPHCIEPTFGLDRTVLAVLTASYKQVGEGDDMRTVLALPASLAPYKVCVSPLLRNKPELVDEARKLYSALKETIGAVVWDDNGNIGKRYRKQDEIGTPFCVTVDFDTLVDRAVTVRNRDSGSQDRVAITELRDWLTLRLR